MILEIKNLLSEKIKFKLSKRFINYIGITVLLFIIGFVPTVILVDYMGIKVMYVLPPIVVVNWILRYVLMYYGEKTN